MHTVLSVYPDHECPLNHFTESEEILELQLQSLIREGRLKLAFQCALLLSQSSSFKGIVDVYHVLCSHILRDRFFPRIVLGFATMGTICLVGGDYRCCSGK